MTDQRFATFAEVEVLDVAALKALLVDGEPPERVWAAWALGLRQGEIFARQLRATAAEEPDPGVRRHLIVILAGAGERLSVLTLAGHDPDDRVRATALQYLARLARTDDGDANDLLARTLAAGPPLLQLGCVAGLRPDARGELWRATEDCITSPDRDLRWTAYEAVIRRGGHEHPAPELARRFLNLEPEQATRRDATRVLHDRAGGDALRRLINDPALEPRLLPEMTESLHAHGVRLGWEEIAALLARNPDAGQHHRVLQLLAGGSEGAIRAELLRLFVDGRPAHLEMRKEVVARLRNAIDQNGAPLTASERPLRDALARHVETAATEAHAAPTDLDEMEDIEVERELLARLAPLDLH